MASSCPGFYRGTNHEQTPFFQNKETKMIDAYDWPTHFDNRVDFSKVSLDIIKTWITQKVTEILETEDDIVIEFVLQQLLQEPDAAQVPHPQHTPTFLMLMTTHTLCPPHTHHTLNYALYTHSALSQHKALFQLVIPAFCGLFRLLSVADRGNASRRGCQGRRGSSQSYNLSHGFHGRSCLRLCLGAMALTSQRSGV